MALLKLLTLSVLLAGCVPATEIPAPSGCGWFCGVSFMDVENRTFTNADTKVFADSLCMSIWEDYDGTGEFYADILSIDAHCVSGEKLVGFKRRDGSIAGFDKVILAYGTNDTGAGIDLTWFRNDYQAVVDTFTGSQLICVLPQAKIAGTKDASAYRDVIKSICSTVVDPIDCGVVYGAHDNKHWHKADHTNFAECIKGFE